MTTDKIKKLRQILKKSRTRSRRTRILSRSEQAVHERRLLELQVAGSLLDAKTMNDASLDQLRATVRALRLAIKNKECVISIPELVPSTAGTQIPKIDRLPSTAGTQKAKLLNQKSISDYFSFASAPRNEPPSLK